MRCHTKHIQGLIDEGRHDEAWNSIGDYQSWCYERISAEEHDADYAGTLLSTAETFFIRILKKEERWHEMLIHTIYKCSSDSRNLKSHYRDVVAAFRRCKYKDADEADAVALFEQIGNRTFRGAEDFLEIRDTVAKWS